MIDDAALFDPTQVYLEIDVATQAEAWRQSRSFAVAASQWNAYLNQLCLQTVVQGWLEDHAATIVPNLSALQSGWEFVNGSAIQVGQRRVILIPSEAIDRDELRVPQEWVDLPNWAGDYYLAVQVDPDQGWVRLNGFVTQQQLKAQGQYAWDDRSYCMDESELIGMTALSVLWELAPAEVTRVETPAMLISTEQATRLIERLGNPAVIYPRLALPFEQWGGLMLHGGWRQRLAEQRRGLPEQRSLMTWLRSGISEMAQQWGWERLEFQAGGVGARGESEGGRQAVTRRLTIADQGYELLVLPVNLDQNIWRFELRSLTVGGSIPAGTVLRLLSEDLQPFEGNEDRAMTAVDALFIEVALEPGEGIVWETDPLPVGYEREILR